MGVADDCVHTKFCSLVRISPICVIEIPGTPTTTGLEMVSVEVGLCVVGAAVALTLVGTNVGFMIGSEVFCWPG